ncbi:3-hydroxyacyl-CoA dehydrogenase NAD-binding domain-containing protein [Paraburkholderia sp. BR13439]|uniref:3-hydroxyacyl-CoA dehydrogenase NAD-binding domain-containing protein n=1 Tax=Paraburkholderia sp. BR13439 TaxID=3236996 RepID=UPI0034CE1531
MGRPCLPSPRLAPRPRGPIRKRRAEMEAHALRSERVFSLAVAIGAGNMGAGIAMALLAGGLAVHLIDRAEASLAAAIGRIGESLGRDVERQPEHVPSCLPARTACTGPH